jgi:hypothetical protein
VPVPTHSFTSLPPHYSYQTQRKIKKQQNKANQIPKINPNKVVEDTTYSCDACERSFTNKIQYQAHLSSHIKCSVPGCEFAASHRVMKLHKLAHTIPNFGKKETPEEIAKYLEERKRRYPTKENIQKKVSLMKSFCAYSYCALHCSYCVALTLKKIFCVGVCMYIYVCRKKKKHRKVEKM